MIKTILDQAANRDRNNRTAVGQRPATSKEYHGIPQWIETKSIAKSDLNTLKKPMVFHPLGTLKKHRVANERQNASWEEMEEDPNRLFSNCISSETARRLFEDKYDRMIPCLNAKTAANATLVGRNILQISTFATRKRSNSDDLA
ncbi:hypothetical protein ACHAXS_000988 [Conticribra weissflogii]